MSAEKIVVEAVTKAFATDGGALSVVDGVSFEVAEGEFVAIVGPSGCGKTTLLHMIAGLERPDAGRILVDGAPVVAASANGILISQHGSVFPWLNVRRNLMFGLNGALAPGEKAMLADRYAAMVGLTGFEEAYPHELSGGMLRRVELARALVVKPQMLFMDEPLAALDALTSIRMRVELLRILGEERHTCVLITHDVEEAIHMADRILVLSPRPARIQSRFDVALPRPRDVASREVAMLKAAILRDLGV
jgi:ABC-type nitrate/sulfonate/bicarbonate transport system ATPase subunit